MLSYISLLLSLSTLSLPLTSAMRYSSGTCENTLKTIDTTANITGTYTLPGVKQSNRTLSLDNDPSRQWSLVQTLSRISHINYSYGEGLLRIPSNQTTGMNNSASDLPYILCAREFFLSVDTRGVNGTTEDDGTCKTFLGAQCAKDLADEFNSKAMEYKRKDKSGPDCFDYFSRTKLPESCSKVLKKNGNEVSLPGTGSVGGTLPLCFY